MGLLFVLSEVNTPIMYVKIRGRNKQTDRHSRHLFYIVETQKDREMDKEVERSD